MFSMTINRMAVLLSIAVPWTVTGCGDEPGRIERSGESIVLVGAEGDGEDRAGVGIGGTARMVGDCLGIDTSTVIWPHGTKIVSDDPLTIDIPGSDQVTIGDHVEGGGDVYSDYVPEGIDTIPPSCPGEVIAFYPN